MKRLHPVPLVRLAGKKRSPAANWQLGIVLAFIAGYINAGGFFIVRHYTSHMTGILSEAADSAALGYFGSMVLLLGFIACFICGATLTTLLVLRAKRHCLHSRFSLPLLVEACLLAGIVCLSFLFPDSAAFNSAVIAMLCFLMGLQNALITKASTAVVRTTHVTGMVTDLGIELGRILSGEGKRAGSDSRMKILLFAIVIATFLTGGVIGALLIRASGTLGLLPVAGLLLMISMPSILRDIRLIGPLKRRRLRHTP